MSALVWLASRGASVFIPVAHTPRHYDLVADFGDRLVRVQVKTATHFRKGRWEVALCTRGGNQSWSGVVKLLDPTRCDAVFVHVGDGRRWYLPVYALGGGSAILLGGPKYAEFEVERGNALPVRTPREMPVPG